MANVTHKWKRGLVWSCSHAKYCDRQAFEAMLKFKQAWKPNYVACLGDFTDMTAFMSSAKGLSGEGEPIEPDIDTGLTHLAEMRPTDVLMGNHEDRIYRIRNDSHSNAIVAYAANKAIDQIESTCKKLKARIHMYDGVFQLVKVEQSDIILTHGTIFNEMAARDMAEMYCNGTTMRKVIFGHTHKVSIQPARTFNGAMGYNIGCLTKRNSLEYAKNRRATLSWTQAFCWFEYCNELGLSSIHITSRFPGEEWRLPI